jgi:hypothetical protein
MAVVAARAWRRRGLGFLFFLYGGGGQGHVRCMGYRLWVQTGGYVEAGGKKIGLRP